MRTRNSSEFTQLGSSNIKELNSGCPASKPLIPAAPPVPCLHPPPLVLSLHSLLGNHATPQPHINLITCSLFFSFSILHLLPSRKHGNPNICSFYHSEISSLPNGLLPTSSSSSEPIKGLSRTKSLSCNNICTPLMLGVRTHLLRHMFSAIGQGRDSCVACGCHTPLPYPWLISLINDNSSFC